MLSITVEVGHLAVPFLINEHVCSVAELVTAVAGATFAANSEVVRGRPESRTNPHSLGVHTMVIEVFDHQLELVERSEGADGLDRARPADEVDIPASIGRSNLVHQLLRVAIDGHEVGSAGGAVRAEHEYVEVCPRPSLGTDGGFECCAAHQDRIAGLLEFHEAVVPGTEIRIYELRRSSVGRRHVTVDAYAHARTDLHPSSPRIRGSRLGYTSVRPRLGNS